jgi:nucleoid-associated protein YgaU
MRSLDTDGGHRYARPAVIASLGVIAVAAALIWAIVRPREGVETPPPPEAAQPQPQPNDPALAPAAPRFDVARISAAGDTVIAGRAPPGATVRIESNGKVIGSANADGRGEWVFVPDAPLPAGAHRLTLSMPQAVGEPVAGVGEVLIIVPGGGRDIAGRPQAETARPLAILIPEGGGGGAPTVLQKPGTDEAATADVAIDVVTYEEGGRLAIAGRAAAGATVRVLIDDRAIGNAVAGADGRWSMAVRRPGLAGDHALSAEVTGADGRTGRFAGRLTLAPPAVGPAATARPGTETLRVEPGENLWRIARETYGRGVAYTIIYDANRQAIADPDLIYPGQVLTLPAPLPPRPAP